MNLNLIFTESALKIDALAPRWVVKRVEDEPRMT